MQKPKRYLILSASTGAGHVRAAEALRASAAQYAPDAVVEHYDIANLLSRPLAKILINSYNRLTPKFPAVWGALYKKTNAPILHDRELWVQTVFHQLAQKVDGNRIARFVSRWRPDHIIATHFLPPLFLGKVHSLSTVITDFAVHTFWLSGNPNHYFVSTDEMKRDLVSRNIPETAATVSGIPIHPSFYEQKSEEELRHRLDIPKERKTILVLSGGYGLIRTDRIVEALLRSAEPMTVVAVAGKNATLKKRLEMLAPPSHIKLIVVGWTDAIDEYLRLADIVIGKPGGLTTTECIALGKPLIAVDPIPGHEDANIRYLEARKFGVLVKNISHLLSLIQQPPAAIAPGLTTNPSRLQDGGRMIWDEITGH